MRSRRNSKRQSELLWTRVVLRKWLNIDSSKDSSDYGADTDDDWDSDNEEEEEEEEEEQNASSKSRRRTSETFRSQYVKAKELRVSACTWNVGGQLPPDDLDIDDWIGVNDPADIYVIGIQEIVPLNPGNIFGVEDSRPIEKWENIIRGTLDQIRPPAPKVKYFSDPPSPSKFKPSEDIPCIEEELLLESDSDIGEEIHPTYDEPYSCAEVNTDISNTKHLEPDCIEIEKLDTSSEHDFKRQVSPKRLDRLTCTRTEDSTDSLAVPIGHEIGKLTKMLSYSERIGLSLAEPLRCQVSQQVFRRTKSLKPVKSFKTYNSFNYEVSPTIALLGELDLEALMKRKRRSAYVKIVSKQMVGIFLSVWVRRSLRRYIQNLRVSTVGVGVMGYIGNKGSVSVSMSVHQTLFCFICSHLTSGEKDGDELKRNADVQEIHRRTQFRPVSTIGLPKSIYDHERIIWLGDLNYRINLSYEKTHDLIAKKEWTKLVEKDQLLPQLRKGRSFDGWSEGTLTFPPTYKYEINSDKYQGADPKSRRNPAWCDRILSYGKAMRLVDYRRAELKFSDHRPVSATYIVEVEVLSPQKLQRAFTLTEAEIENELLVASLVY